MLSGLSVIHFSGFLRSWFAQGVVAVVILESNTQVTADRDNRADTVKKQTIKPTPLF